MVSPGASLPAAIALPEAGQIWRAGTAKTVISGRFGRRRHANQLFWHVFDLLAGQPCHPR
jgi:hypothetical protein